MDTLAVITELNRMHGWGLASTLPEAELEAQLAEKIDSLIQQDFEALVQLLYRIDVGEDKLRRMLAAQADEDAGKLIARLILERQWQKIESRRLYRRPDSGSADDEAERW